MHIKQDIRIYSVQINILFALFVILFTQIIPNQVWASQRVALVIGNAQYQHAPGLANPLNDARDLGAAFDRLGFAVTLATNSDYDSLRRTLQDFKRAASASSIAVIFYAGHGIEIDNRNFLVPVDARLASDEDVEYETVPLELVSGAVRGASELRLVILDACRDNPFIASMRCAGATRSIGRGLARIEPSGETLVAYAAKGGTVALDGDGRNSPFTKALLAHVEQPGLEVGLMFRHIRDAVLAETGGRQEPFVYGSLSAKGAYLTSPPDFSGTANQMPSVSSVPNLNQTGREQETVFWNSIKDSESADEYRAYLETYPKGIFAALARSRLKRLEEPNVGGTADRTKDDQAEEEVFSLNLSRQESRLIQRGLAHLGFKPGPVDGLFGSRTRQAIESWQEASGHERTGRLLRTQADVLAEIGKEAFQVDEKKAKAEAERKAKEERERNRLSPGQEFRDCADCPLMTVIPGGTFTMGSSSSEEGRDDDEGPQHRVSIDRFAVGKFEVTFKEWDACVSGGGCGGYRPEDEGWGRGNRPVIYVGWDYAEAYVRWLSRKTGHQYRLLSESEWEYAARAGTRGPFHFDSTISTDQANYDGNDTYGNGRKGVYRAKTMPVGSFPSNRFGLHDMHGNVWEWVEDCWHESYASAPGDGRAWTTGGDCGERVLRGGSWYDKPWFLRSAVRGWSGFGLESGSSVIGFRVARTLTP